MESLATPSLASQPWDSWLETKVDALHQRSLFRTLRPTIPGQSAIEVQMRMPDFKAWLSGIPPLPSHLPILQAREDLQTIKLFSLNDYLGLSTHPLVRQATADAAQRCGSGPRSSALVGGYTCHHRDLETALADLKGTEEALLFPTGFAANLAIVSSLAGGGNVAIFSDELNHASLVDGARLARRGGSTLHVYRHNDMAHLETLLTACPSTHRKLIITDSLFSMDGDFADLRALAALRRQHDCLLAVDEAHATLVCGEHGGGAVEAQGVVDQVDVHVGTLSKAFGCMGGFVACSRQWKDLLVNLGRAQVYSTSLPVPIVAAAQTALRVARDEPWRRRHLWELVGRLGQALGCQAQSPVVPVVLGSEEVTMRACTELLRRGLHVPGIRPPTVPAGTSRLRISLSAAHSTADVDALAVAVGEVCACTGSMTARADGAGWARSRL